MKRILLALAMGVALVPGTAKAEKPDFGYFHTSFGIPWQYSASTTRTGILDGKWDSRSGIGRRPSVFSLDAVAFGAGVGYNGWNLQADVRSLGDAARADITVGKRFKLSISRAEVWARLAAGPSYTFSVSNFSAQRDTGAGLTAVAELGADFFVVPERLALGLKGIGAPGYTFPTTFGVDLGLAVGLRLLL